MTPTLTPNIQSLLSEFGSIGAVNSLIEAVRNTPDPNPWKRSEDEEIAEVLVKQIERSRQIERRKA